MALVFTQLSWWLWGGKEHETTTDALASFNSSLDLNLGMRESDILKIASVNGAKMRSASRKVKQKWQRREKKKIDREYDLVLVPSDGGWGSGSDSDESDWSVGWMEPHAPDFQGNNEEENSFAVLVRCYAHGNEEIVDNSKNQHLGAIVGITNGYSTKSKEYLEQWLSSLRRS